MISRKMLILVWLFSSAGLSPGRPRARAPSPAGAAGPLQLGANPLRFNTIQRACIYGRVAKLNGEPLPEATVKVDIGTGGQSVQALKTNLRGEFRCDVSWDASLYERLTVKVTANKAGYQEAEETADFGATNGTWGIEVLMREKDIDEDQLSLAILINNVAPKLCKAAAGNSKLAPVRKDFVRGSEEFLDRGDPVRASRLLAKVVKNQPECIECRTLLGLALLNGGSYASARGELNEACRLSAAQPKGNRSADCLLTLGVLEAWGGQYKEAAGLFIQALDLDPNNSLVLQELGRTLIFQGNWEAADDYLKRAIRAAASQDAHLLRVRALLEQGDSEEADTEMTRYIGGRDIKDLPVAARSVYMQLHSRLILKSYENVKSVVGEPLPQLIKAFPELKGLNAAVSQEPLGSILHNVGQGVDSFFHDFSNTVCLEQIRQERVGKDGKAKNSLNQNLRYLLLTRSENWGLGLEEYRTDSRGERTALGGLNSGFMLTSGFASASLIFHSAYQSGTSFRYLGRQLIQGRDCHVVAFAQRPETARIIERFNADGASAMVLLQGLAWIDVESYRIVRLRTDLLRPVPTIRLHRQTTEIQYDEVDFKEIASPMWLPREVAVIVEWKGKKFHNLHRYSEFKLFNVATSEKVHVGKLRGRAPVAPKLSSGP